VFNGRVIQPMQIQQAAIAQVGAAPGNAPVAPGVPAIAAVRPVDDKIIVSTTDGQLFALRTANGTLAWQTRLSASAPVSRLAATDDFVVAKVDDAASTQLVAVETLTGQLLKRMTFANESGNVPVNFALAPDGTLVWIQQDRLCGKDLFDAKKKELNYEQVAGQNEANRQPANVNFNRPMDGTSAIYSGAVNPDQLLISEGRILVVTHQGRYVSVYSLETGKLLDTDSGGGKAEARFLTSNGTMGQVVNDWSASMHLVGSKLYVCTRTNGPMCYDLDQLGATWTGSMQPDAHDLDMHEPFIGQDHLVLLDRIVQRPGVNVNPKRVQVHCYSRAVDAGSGKEKGLIDDFPFIRDDSGISEFQGVNGGFYYLTGDKKLHYLQGSVP
jgi:outer membrane protein assembly factor BamB